MLFFLRKLIEMMLLPLGLAGIFAVLGVVFRRRRFILIGLVLLYTFSLPVVSRDLISPLEKVYPPLTVASAPVVDAIVVLSGNIVRGISPAGVQWGDASNRFFAGFELAAAGKARLLVLSSGPAPKGNSISQGAVLRRSAISHGLPPDRIVLTTSVLTTEEEARAVSGLPNLHKILLVTSAFHMERAVLLFRARGFDVSPFPSDQRVLGNGEPDSFSWLPGPGPLRESEMALREYYGLAVYRSLSFFR